MGKKNRAKRQKRDDLNDSNNSSISAASGMETDADLADKLKEFLMKLENLDKTTAEVIAISKDPRVSICIKQLCSLANASSLLLQALPPQIDVLKKEIATIPEKIEQAVEEKERRRSVVISFLPEAGTHLTTTARAQADKNKVVEILDKCEIEALPSAVYRLGRRTAQQDSDTQQGRPRLVKVVFDHSRAASDFLKKRGILKTTPFRNILIRESLTKEELMARSAVLREKFEKNSALSADEKRNDPWIYYAGRLIRRSEIPQRQRNGN